MKYSICLFFMFWSLVVFGQSDANDCFDYPLFKRMPNMFITQCSSGNDAIDVQLTDSASDMISGNRYYSQYAYYTNDKTPAPSFSKIVSNYEAIIIAGGGRKVYYSESSGVATFQTKNKGKELWVVLNDYSENLPGGFEMVVVEKDARKKITALSMNDDLSTKGSTVLYINFDKEKNAISAESAGMIDLIADLLLTDTDLKVSIEAHTDNTGSPGENLKISEARAKSVYDAVITKGVDKKRLKYKGWGQTKPISENTSEEGRARNNRIELIKM